MARPEIVIGMVGAIGTDLEMVSKTLEALLADLGYLSIEVKLSELLKNAPVSVGDLVEEPVDERIDSYMTAGNTLRETWKRGDALAILSVLKIRQLRQKKFYEEKGLSIPDEVTDESDAAMQEQVENTAFILRSLKHPDEVSKLREVYGSSFFLVSAYTSESQRLEQLSKRIAQSYHKLRSNEYRSHAFKLIQRDTEELGNKYGQQVRETFWQGDAFVDASKPEIAKASLRRILHLWFGYPYHTPTRDEYMMFCAQSAAYRSASMGRQVGAVIATESGSVLSTGTNEVPKAGGGPYWEGDEPDHRDHCLGHDSSDTMRRELLADVLTKLESAGLLNSGGKNQGEITNDLLYGKDRVMKSAEFNQLTEFQRAVHAEMSAIMDASSRGVPLAGTFLYCTTFPCHGCARHIVASGISKVVYIEPYAKSLVRDLYSDSISVDDMCSDGTKVRFEPFVGLAPRRYMELFAMVERKEKDGSTKKWNPSQAVPRLGGWQHTTSVTNEQNVETLAANLVKEYQASEMPEEGREGIE